MERCLRILEDWLAARAVSATAGQLQELLDAYRRWYNDRLNTAVGTTSRQAWDRTKTKSVRLDHNAG